MILAAFSDCPGASSLVSDVLPPKLLKSLWFVCEREYSEPELSLMEVSNNMNEIK